MKAKLVLVDIAANLVGALSVVLLTLAASQRFDVNSSASLVFKVQGAPPEGLTSETNRLFFYLRDADGRILRCGDIGSGETGIQISPSLPVSPWYSVQFPAAATNRGLGGLAVFGLSAGSLVWKQNPSLGSTKVTAVYAAPGETPLVSEFALSANKPAVCIRLDELCNKKRWVEYP